MNAGDAVSGRPESESNGLGSAARVFLLSRVEPHVSETPFGVFTTPERAWAYADEHDDDRMRWEEWFVTAQVVDDPDAELPNAGVMRR